MKRFKVYASNVSNDPETNIMRRTAQYIKNNYPGADIEEGETKFGDPAWVVSYKGRECNVSFYDGESELVPFPEIKEWIDECL